MGIKVEDMEATLAAYRDALQGMISQYGGDETCMSANEYAVEVLESSNAGRDLLDNMNRVMSEAEATWKVLQEVTEERDELQGQLDRIRTLVS
jgi:hypothetical protein